MDGLASSECTDSGGCADSGGAAGAQSQAREWGPWMNYATGNICARISYSAPSRLTLASWTGRASTAVLHVEQLWSGCSTTKCGESSGSGGGWCLGWEWSWRASSGCTVAGGCMVVAGVPGGVLVSSIGACGPSRGLNIRFFNRPAHLKHSNTHRVSHFYATTHNPQRLSSPNLPLPACGLPSQHLLRRGRSHRQHR